MCQRIEVDGRIISTYDELTKVIAKDHIFFIDSRVEAIMFEGGHDDCLCGIDFLNTGEAAGYIVDLSDPLLVKWRKPMEKSSDSQPEN